MKPTAKWRKLVLLTALGAGVALAAQYVVKVRSIDVKTGKGSGYPVVGTLNVGETANVVREEPNGWLVVKVGDKEGFVKATAFDAPRGKLIAESSNSQADPAAAAAAARGIRDEAIAYSHDKNLSTAPLEKMQDNRNRVTGTKWLGFASEGHVGPYKN